MKTLHLLRHAKSSWKDPGLDDHDRPLSRRGRETARGIAAYLRRAKIAPDLVICSTAVRARQTLDPIAKAIKPPKVAREASKVARQSSAMRSITPRPVTSPAGSVRPSTPTARGTSDQQPRQMSYRSRVVPLSDETERDSQDSFPASDAPSWTPIRRIGTPIPPKRG